MALWPEGRGREGQQAPGGPGRSSAGHWKGSSWVSDPPNIDFLTLSNEWPWVTLSLVSLQAPQGHLQLNPVYTGVTRGSESQAHTAPTASSYRAGPRPHAPALNLCGVCRALAAPPVTLCFSLRQSPSVREQIGAGTAQGTEAMAGQGHRVCSTERRWLVPRGRGSQEGGSRHWYYRALGGPFGGLLGQMAICLPWWGQHGDRSGAAQQTLQWPH